MTNKSIIIAAAIVALGLAMNGVFPRFQVHPVAGKPFAYKIDTWTGDTSRCVLNKCLKLKEYLATE